MNNSRTLLCLSFILFIVSIQSCKQSTNAVNNSQECTQCTDSLDFQRSYSEGVRFYKNDQYDSALISYRKAFKTKTFQFDTLKSLGLMINTAVAYKLDAQYDSALSLYEKVIQTIDINQQRDGFLRLKSLAQNNIGNIYLEQNLYEIAQSNLNAALTAKRQLGDSSKIPSTLNSLGNVSKALGDFEVALNYYRQALEIAESFKNGYNAASSHLDIGVVFNNQKRYNEAIKEFEVALEYSDTIQQNGIRIKNYAYHNLINTYSELNDLNKVDYYGQLLKEVLDKSGSDYDFSSFYLQRSTLLLNRELYDQAERYARLSILDAKDIESRETLSQAYLNLSQALEKQGRVVEALDALNSHLDLHKEIFDIDQNDVILKIDAELRFKNDQREIEFLKSESEKNQAIRENERTSESRRVILITGSLIIVILTILIYFIRSKNKSKRKREEERQQELREKLALKEKLNTALREKLISEKKLGEERLMQREKELEAQRRIEKAKAKSDKEYALKYQGEKIKDDLITLGHSFLIDTLLVASVLEDRREVKEPKQYRYDQILVIYNNSGQAEALFDDGSTHTFKGDGAKGRYGLESIEEELKSKGIARVHASYLMHLNNLNTSFPLREERISVSLKKPFRREVWKNMKIGGKTERKRVNETMNKVNISLKHISSINEVWNNLNQSNK